MNKLTIVMYHYVRPIVDSDYPGIKGLEFHKFKNQLDYLQENYKIISTEEINNAIIKNKRLPLKACWLTFDDGFKDHYRYVMPELIKRKLSGAFFPPSIAIKEPKVLNVHSIHHILSCCKDTKKLVQDLNDLCKQSGISDSSIKSYLEIYKKQGRLDDPNTMYVKRMLQYGLNKQRRDEFTSILFKKYVGISRTNFSESLYMNIKEVSQLVKSGMYVGSHGSMHIWLNKANETEVKNDIIKSLQFLEEIKSSIKNWVMCYPYGGYNQSTINLIKKYGASIGVTTDYGVADIRNTNPLTLPRIDTNEFPK